MSIIAVQGLRKVFTLQRKPEGGWARLMATFRPQVIQQEAVRGIDLAVERGEAVAFIGPNGAGKSTTIKMLTGILHPTAGQASVLGFTRGSSARSWPFRSARSSARSRSSGCTCRRWIPSTCSPASTSWTGRTT